MSDLEKSLDELIKALKALSLAFVLYASDCEAEAIRLKKEIRKEVEL